MANITIIQVWDIDFEEWIVTDEMLDDALALMGEGDFDDLPIDEE